MGLADMFKTKTPQEVMRDNKRMLDRSIRELDRERMVVEGQCKKTIAEMKKMAKVGQEDVVRMMAQDVVRMRSQITKFYKMRAQMQSVSMQMQVCLLVFFDILILLLLVVVRLAIISR